MLRVFLLIWVGTNGSMSIEVVCVCVCVWSKCKGLTVGWVQGSVRGVVEGKSTFLALGLVKVFVVGVQEVQKLLLFALWVCVWGGGKDVVTKALSEAPEWGPLTLNHSNIVLTCNRQLFTFTLFGRRLYTKRLTITAKQLFISFFSNVGASLRGPPEPVVWGLTRRPVVTFLQKSLWITASVK